MDKIDKLLFIDTETSGLNPKVHGILQLATMLVDLEDNFIAEFNEKMRPPAYREIDDAALAINKFTVSDINNQQNTSLVRDKFKDFLVENKCTPKNTYLVGWNIMFDVSFINDSFHEGLLRTHVNYHHMDLSCVVGFLKLWGIAFEDLGSLSLKNTAEYIDRRSGIKPSRVYHNAYSDVIHTVHVYNYVRDYIGFRSDRIHAKWYEVK
jgi:DNA polymerase III epsilon subunit-like protein